MEKDSFSVPFKKYKKEEEYLHAFEHALQEKWETMTFFKRQER